MNLWEAVKHVLAVRTNVILIVSSACGYYFLAGVQTFGSQFAKQQYDINQAVANLLLLVVGIGAIGGVLAGGALGDRLLRRGYLNGRIMVSAISGALAVVVFIPALFSRSASHAVLWLIFAVLLLSAQNPPLDAARLDIMPPFLWGRAEAVRTFLRGLAQALAPLLFGAVSDHVFGGGRWACSGPRRHARATARQRVPALPSLAYVPAGRGVGGRHLRRAETSLRLARGPASGVGDLSALDQPLLAAHVEHEPAGPVHPKGGSGEPVHRDPAAAQEVARAKVRVQGREPAAAPGVVVVFEPREQRARRASRSCSRPVIVRSEPAGWRASGGSWSRVWLTLIPIPRTTMPSRARPALPRLSAG